VVDTFFNILINYVDKLINELHVVKVDNNYIFWLIQ